MEEVKKGGYSGEVTSDGHMGTYTVTYEMREREEGKSCWAYVGWDDTQSNGGGGGGGRGGFH